MHFEIREADGHHLFGTAPSQNDALWQVQTLLQLGTPLSEIIVTLKLSEEDFKPSAVPAWNHQHPG